MSRPDQLSLAHLLEHHPDPEDGSCDLCEAASIASVVLPHALALGERSEIALALMAAELAAQSIEQLSHAETIDLDVVFAAIRRRVNDLRADRETPPDADDMTGSRPVRH